MNDLEKEIEELRQQLSVTLPEELASIVGANDNSDNSELCEILERQHYASVRLRQLTDRLHVCKSINLKTIPKNKIGIGSIVTVQDLMTEQIFTYKLIVSEVSDCTYENFSEVTLQSPIGRALLDKVANDEVVIQVLKNKIHYKILNFITVHDL